MAMDLVGASLTTSEVRDISRNIEEIGNGIDETMKSVDNIMTTLTGQSEGGVIQKTETAVKELSSLATILVTSIIGIGIGIGDYLKEMISQDNQAAETLQKSTESNVYGR
ncbi:MAG: hypothetical protein Q4P27_04425 [Eubacteriales bacterium]|nr:hypothetical protein [Eubacteriales bacterium]